MTTKPDTPIDLAAWRAANERVANQITELWQAIVVVSVSVILLVLTVVLLALRVAT